MKKMITTAFLAIAGLAATNTFAAESVIEYPHNIDQFMTIQGSGVRHRAFDGANFEMTYQMTRSCARSYSFVVKYEDANGIRNSTGDGLVTYVQLSSPKIGQKFRVDNAQIMHFNGGKFIIDAVTCIDEDNKVYTPQSLNASANSPAAQNQGKNLNTSTPPAGPNNPLGALLNGLLGGAK